MQLWERLGQIAATVNEPWILAGDFNAILSVRNGKGKGGLKHTEHVVIGSILLLLTMDFMIWGFKVHALLGIEGVSSKDSIVVSVMSCGIFSRRIQLSNTCTS